MAYMGYGTPETVNGFLDHTDRYGMLCAIARTKDDRFEFFTSHALLVLSLEEAQRYFTEEHVSEAAQTHLALHGWCWIRLGLEQFEDEPLQPDAVYAERIRQARLQFESNGRLDMESLAYQRLDNQYGKRGFTFATAEGHEVHFRYGNLRRWAPTHKEARKLHIAGFFIPNIRPMFRLTDDAGRLLAWIYEG